MGQCSTVGLTHPQSPEQQVILMLLSVLCKHSDFQPLDGHYEKGVWDPSLGTSTLCVPDLTHVTRSARPSPSRGERVMQIVCKYSLIIAKMAVRFAMSAAWSEILHDNNQYSHVCDSHVWLWSSTFTACLVHVHVHAYLPSQSRQPHI